MSISSKGTPMKEEQNYLMVTVSGQDGPGIAAAFTGILSEHHVEIMDIEQASPQDLLGLYFLLDLSSATGNKDSVIKDLLFEANQLGLNLQFKLYSQSDVHISNQRHTFCYYTLWRNQGACSPDTDFGR